MMSSYAALAGTLCTVFLQYGKQLCGLSTACPLIMTCDAIELVMEYWLQCGPIKLRWFHFFCTSSYIPATSTFYLAFTATSCISNSWCEDSRFCESLLWLVMPPWCFLSSLVADYWTPHAFPGLVVHPQLWHPSVVYLSSLSLPFPIQLG